MKYLPSRVFSNRKGNSIAANCGVSLHYDELLQYEYAYMQSSGWTLTGRMRVKQDARQMGYHVLVVKVLER
jgi:hypothetical protein